MEFLRKAYIAVLCEIFWFSSKRLFTYCACHVPQGEDAKYMKPSFHFYHQERDMLGFARVVIEHEEQRCQEESTKNSPTSSGP